jgi:CheY-like chemotaxis protein
MNITVIDDEPSVLRVVSVILERLGHTVHPFSGSIPALAACSRDTDLVISDIAMPEVDGFGVAEHVATRLGTTPPKTLLISGADHSQRLASFPPSKVIGILRKPMTLDALSRVVDILEHMRSGCPSMMAPLCPHVIPPGHPQTTPDSSCYPCNTPNYAACPHYDAICGNNLRTWIAMPRGTSGSDSGARLA